jgi:hypothetical protein
MSLPISAYIWINRFKVSKLFDLMDKNVKLV